MKYENLDQILDRNLSNGKKEKPSKIRKNKKKGIVVVIIAGTLALITAITGLVHFGKKKNTTNDKTPTKTVEATTNISTLDLNDLGDELAFKTQDEQNKEKYGNTSGNVDVNKIVEKDGVYYVDQASADKSKDVGKTTTDTKNGKYVVESDGTVKEKETGYEIKDSKTGKTVEVNDSNNDGIPDGYEYNKELDGIYEEADNTDLYTKCDANYYGYDENGDYTIIFKKGDIVLKETLKRIKKELSTSSKEPTANKEETTTKQPETTSKKEETTTKQPETTSKKEETTTKQEETTTSTSTDEGVVNADGTYSIYGLTFESKADYQQWVLQGYEGYIEADGIMKSEETLTSDYQYTK